MENEGLVTLSNEKVKNIIINNSKCSIHQSDDSDHTDSKKTSLELTNSKTKANTNAPQLKITVFSENNIKVGKEEDSNRRRNEAKSLRNLNFRLLTVFLKLKI